MEKMKHGIGKSNFLFNYLTSKTDNVPELVMDSGKKEWVPWGKDNKMPNELFFHYNRSAMHRSIIDSRVNMIVGEGVIENDEDGLTTENFLKNPNPHEDFNALLKKVAYDYEIFGLAYLEIIYSHDRMSISQVNHIDASKIRWGKKNLNNLTHFYYSENWNKRSVETIMIPRFNTAIKAEFPRQILPIVRYTPTVDYYTYPSYFGAMKYISIDYEIANFHENNIKSGFQPKMLINFPDDSATEDERDEIANSFEKQYSGTSNAGGIIITYSNPDASQKVTVDTLSSSDLGDQYMELATRTQQQILIGHKVTNENLVGISTPGKLGGSSELIQAHELYYNDVIKHEQNDILHEINKVLDYNAMNTISFVNDKPLAQELSESAMTQILTPNELREIIGYEPVEVVPETELSEHDHSNCTCHSHSHKFEASTEDLLYQIDNKEIDTGESFELNGENITLSQEVIDRDNSISSEANDRDGYIWTLGPGGLSKQNCPICVQYAGQVRSLRAWKRTAIPATREGGDLDYSRVSPGPFGTYCEQHCTCKLIKVNR